MIVLGLFMGRVAKSQYYLTVLENKAWQFYVYVVVVLFLSLFFPTRVYSQPSDEADQNLNFRLGFCDRMLVNEKSDLKPKMIILLSVNACSFTG